MSKTMAEAPVLDARTLREVLAVLAPDPAAVVVTAGADDDAPHRGAAGTFAVVSAHPPLALVTMPRGSAVAKALSTQPFAVEVPSAGAVRGTGNAATVWCTPWNVYDGGDHIIAVGEVTAYTLGSASLTPAQQA